MYSRTVVRGLVILVFLAAAFLFAGYAWLQTSAGKRWLADWIEELASSPDRKVEVGTLDGAIPFAPAITGISVSDTEGPWLALDRADIRLDPIALLRGVARFETIDIDRLTVHRIPSVPEKKKDESLASPYTWPALPVALTVDRLRVAEVALGEPVLGDPARLSINGAAMLGDAKNGLSMDLAIHRTDGSKGYLDARMRYVADARRLTTMLRAHESAGGLLARMLGLSGLPALTVDLTGDGTLDDWQARLEVEGGNDLRLEAPVTITAAETGHRLLLDARGRLAALADDRLRPSLESETRLGASVMIGTNHQIQIDRLDLVGGFGTMSLIGSLDLREETTDLALTFEPAAPARFAQLMDGASWDRLHLSATVAGPLFQPNLTFSLDGRDLAFGDIGLDWFSSTVEADSAGPITHTGPSINLDADVRVFGLNPGIDLNPGLLEPELQLAARGSVTIDGNVILDRLAIDGPAVRLSASGAARALGRESAMIAGALTMHDLSQIGLSRKQPPAGEATAEFSADWDGKWVGIETSAEARNLSTGIAALDMLLGASPQLTVAASYGVDGAIGIESLTLSGSGLEMMASGDLGGESSVVEWQLLLADMAMANPTFEGALEARGRLSGPASNPSATAWLTAPEAIVAGFSVSELRIDVEVTDLTTRPAADVMLTAEVDGLATSATAEMRVQDENRVLMDHLNVRLASLIAEGALTLDTKAGTFEGDVSARAGDLTDLASFFGAPLSGQMDAKLSLSAPGGLQTADVEVTAAGAGLRGTAEAERVDLVLGLSDPFGAPEIAARLQAEEIRAGVVELNQGAATARGNLERVTVGIEVADELLDLNVRGDLESAGTETRIQIADLSARYRQVEARLPAPARILAAPGVIRIEDLVLLAGGGRLAVNGHVGDASDLLVSVSEWPLSGLTAPDLDVSGRLEGQFRLTGNRNAPRATGDLTASGVTLGALGRSGIAHLDVSTALDWNGNRLHLDSSVRGGFGDPFIVSATLAAPADPQTGLPAINGSSSLAGVLRGNLRLGILNDLLAARGDRVDGTLGIDLALSGRVSDPRIGGNLSMKGGSYRSALTGLSLNDIRLKARAEGDRFTIGEGSARTPGGGAVRASGQVGIDAVSGFPTDVTIELDDALILDSDVVSAKVSGRIGAAGALARSLALDGRLTIQEAEIQLPERLPTSIPTLEVTEVNMPPELKARRPVPRPTSSGRDAPLPLSLDLAIDAPGRIFVRGRGLDAEVGGEVTVRGSADAPVIGGGFELRSGHLDALARRFAFDEGVVTLPEDGSLDADIRFVATTRAGRGSAQITVAGRASAPQVTIESDPELPQDEVLAQVLFGKRGDSLTALESVQLARSALELTGIGADASVVHGVRERMGLSLIDFRRLLRGADGLTPGLRRRIAENIDLGLSQEFESGSGRATVEIQVTPNVSLETEVGTDNRGRSGVSMEWEY